MVVVDVERQRHLVEQRRRLPHPLAFAQSSATSTARHGVLGKLAAQLVERQERVLGGRIGVAAQVHDGVLAERVEAELQAEDRPERVPVGVLVGDQQEAVGVAQCGRDGGDVTHLRGELIDQL